MTRFASRSASKNHASFLVARVFFLADKAATAAKPGRITRSPLPHRHSVIVTFVATSAQRATMRSLPKIQKSTVVKW